MTHHPDTVYLMTLSLSTDQPDTDMSGAFAQLRDQLRDDRPDMAAYGLGSGSRWNWENPSLNPPHSPAVSDIAAVEFIQSAQVDCGLSLALLGTTDEMAGAAAKLASDCDRWASWLPGHGSWPRKPTHLWVG